MSANNNTQFDSRIANAEQFQDALFAKLLELGFTVAVNGTEHTHPAFAEKLRHSTDQTSLAIRFQPDGVACIGSIPRTIYVEAKAARNIERTAYEQYMKLYNAGNVLAVVFGKLDWQWNFIEAIELSRGEDTVAKFPPARRFPVADGWIVPSQAQHWQTVKAENPGASGTAYREIVPASLNAWDAFKPAIVKRLTAASEVHHVMGKD